MNTHEVIAQYEKHVIANYRRSPIVIVKGQGSRIWDADGKEYLDLFPGWGVSGLGHCHPRVVEAVQKQAAELMHIDNTYYSLPQGELAQMLSTRAGGMLCFFSNSGAESAEGAIKLARLHGNPKYKVISFQKSFHGRTYAAMTATGQAAKQEGLAPLVPGFSYAEFNNLASVEALMDDETCAVLLEPVQGEGGVRPATKEFLQGLRTLCDERGALLIFDEVQTAPARLGTWFGFQHFGVQPDIVTSAKAIAGGMQLGLIMATPAVAPSLVPGTHASTFGGHAVSTAAGVAMIQVIEEEKLLENVAAMGAVIDQQVAKLREEFDCISEYRRCGLMVGIELDCPGAEIVEACMNNGLRINCTQGTILRILPALNITEAELTQGFGILADAMANAGAPAKKL